MNALVEIKSIGGIFTSIKEEGENWIGDILLMIVCGLSTGEG